MAMRIPFLSKAESGRSLQRCLDFAAEETGYDTFAVTIMLSSFLEALAGEVAMGRGVLIPGFGRFAPEPLPERYLKTSRDKTPRCRPTFAASRGFRNQVRLGAHPSDVEIKRKRRYEKNHSDRNRGKGQRVWSSQQALREHIHAQLGYARKR